MILLLYNFCMETKRKIILASGSPRRLDILRAHGIEPIVCPSQAEENLPDYRNASEVPMFLALKKGLDVLENNDFKDGTIIAADTIVYHGDLSGHGRIMGKPADHKDGFNMLASLRNDSHYVITGVCLIDVETGIKRVSKEITKVWFTNYTDEELNAYLDTPESYDKAGGYAIQGTFAKYIKKIDGSYENVIGFPWELIKKELTLL